MTESRTVASVESIREQPVSFVTLHRELHRSIASVIKGKDEAIDLVLIAFLAEGHVLIEDVPGVGKTTLAKALARSIDAHYGRIQFTPDLLPTDVLGVNVWLRGAERFELHRGPIFANIVLGDELNRASPKTQSALLEAMAEQQVTIDGTTHDLPPPFLVLATQNPIDHAGTHPLPESQLDRFLLRVSLGYPDRDAALAMLGDEEAGPSVDGLVAVVTAAQVNSMIDAVRRVHIAAPLQGYLLDLVGATRDHDAAALGASPRAALALQRAARARAATCGRDHVIPDDLKVLAEPVLAHRIVVGVGGRSAAVDGRQIVRDVLEHVPLPSRSGKRPRA